jgi:hypothetical protein
MSAKPRGRPVASASTALKPEHSPGWPCRLAIIWPPPAAQPSICPKGISLQGLLPVMASADLMMVIGFHLFSMLTSTPYSARSSPWIV